MNKKGFTLIELLAVILILSIIALIAIPTVNDIIQESKVGAAKATANNIVTAYEQYYQLCQLRSTGCVLSFDHKNGSEVKAAVGIKGDIPGVFIKLNIDQTTGNAVIEYIKEGIYCSNTSGEVKCGSKVENGATVLN